MKSRDLYQLLESPGPSEALREAIAPALPAYRDAIAEQGRSAPVAIDCDGALLVVAAEHLATLCEAFLAGHLDAFELGYLARALERAPDFTFVSDRLEDITGLLADGTAHKDAVVAVLRYLREHAA